MLPNNLLLHNRYRIEKKIAQGGMGAVYKARDKALDTTVAVKEALVSDAKLLAAFKKEATRLARLRHPALPNVIDHFVEGHSQYLVMEYIEGQDLVEMLSANNLSQWCKFWDGGISYWLCLSICMAKAHPLSTVTSNRRTLS